MAYSSLEVMRRTIHFQDPGRIGLRFDRIGGEGDVYRIFVLPPKDKRDNSKPVSVKKKIRPISGAYDEWGCLWESTDSTGSDMGQPVNIPIVDLEEDLPNFQFPDPKAEGRFEGLEEALDEAEAQQKYVQLNSPHCIWERMHFLHGYQPCMEDILMEPELSEELINKLKDFQIGIIEEAWRLGKGRIHCYDTTDDWGSQLSTMISPNTFRELFKPAYVELFKCAHDCGMDVRFHTDGKVNALIPDFIDMGADIINIHQPRLLGIDEVSKIAQGKVCFEVAVDVQSTLPTGDKALIEQEVKELVSKWGTPHGGLIGVEYGYLKAISTTKESMLYAMECFKKYGVLQG